MPLDAGFSCPNRDGTISTRGCIFCNPAGSGTDWAQKGMGLKEQYLHWTAFLRRKYKAELYWAYLQSFSNTHCSPTVLQKTLEDLRGLPGLRGLCIGTRPDCLDQSKLKILTEFEVQETWLELGLQSARDRTLVLINRGHDSEAFTEAVHGAMQQGLKVCTHLVLGLPKEDLHDVLYSISVINNLPVQGLKLHNLYVCKDTPVESQWRKGSYQPLSRVTYLNWLARVIPMLRSDIVLHRLAGDPAPGELLAPEWAARKRQILRELHHILEAENLWQGKYWDAPGSVPDWY